VKKPLFPSPDLFLREEGITDPKPQSLPFLPEPNCRIRTEHRRRATPKRNGMVARTEGEHKLRRSPRWELEVQRTLGKEGIPIPLCEELLLPLWREHWACEVSLRDKPAEFRKELLETVPRTLGGIQRYLPV
jgi:hypothetical protein